MAGYIPLKERPLGEFIPNPCEHSEAFGSELLGDVLAFLRERNVPFLFIPGEEAHIIMPAQTESALNAYLLERHED